MPDTVNIQVHAFIVDLFAGKRATMGGGVAAQNRRRWLAIPGDNAAQIRQIAQDDILL
jgi:hypothetical protein